MAPPEGEYKYATEPEVQSRPMVPASNQRGRYPLIDHDPHIRRVINYMRPSDYAVAAACTVGTPGAIWFMEKTSPTWNTRANFMRIIRLNTFVGLMAGFIFAAHRSSLRFYGVNENAREVAMDMREMTNKAKRGEPLYGTSQLSEYMQGVAHRNSRYSAIALFLFPMFNFVNHPYHGVDTAKYYEAAERELEVERLAREGAGAGQ